MAHVFVLTRGARTGRPRRPRRWLARDWKAYLLPLGSVTWQLAGKGGVGVTLWSFEKGGHRVPLWPALSWYGDLLMVRRKKQPEAKATAPHLAPVETEILSRCMALVEHCAATVYDDGSPRKTGWFTVRTRGSSWEIEVKDPDGGCKLVIIQNTIDDALAVVQAMLTADDAPWEPDRWLQDAQHRPSRKK